MSQMTPGQARVVDPILTTHALGYVRPGNVGQFLFPRVDVATLGGRILTFGKEAFRRYNTKRAPGESTKRIQFGYEGNPYAIVPAALEAVVPDEIANEAAQGPKLDASTDAVDLVLDVMDLDHECDCATIARNAANYDADHKMTLVGADRWGGASGTPTTDVGTAKEAVRKTIGVRPNTIILSPSAFAAAQNNAEILDRLKYTSPDSVTADMLAKLWQVAYVYVGDAIVATGQDDDLGDVWGNDVIVAYVAPPNGSNRHSAARPSYGYTYSQGGQPNVRQAYRDENRQSWIHPVNNNRAPVLSGMVAGFLIKDAGAPAA